MTTASGPEPTPAGGADRLPLLPRGTVVFEAIPMRAIVIDAMTAVIGDGTLVARDGERGAVILVRGGAVWEVHLVDGDQQRTGSGLLTAIQGWGNAAVTAERLDRPLVDLCATLLRGDTLLYDDLRLLWVTWPSLLADLGRRGGTYVVEITTPVGRGVTCVAAGRQALSYTDIHPSLGDPALLEAMASNREGSVRVRRVGEETLAGVRTSELVQPAPLPESPKAAAPRDDAPADPLPGMSWAAPWDTTWRADEAAAPTEVEPRPSTWREFTATALQPETGVLPSRPTSVAEVLDELRSIARRRLQLSAGRVESVLDEGALEGRPIDAVLEEIRALSIRGVMPATVEEMVDEMAGAVSAHAG